MKYIAALALVLLAQVASAAPMQCPDGIGESLAVVGFVDGMEEGLFCPQYAFGCVKNALCPQLSPAFCPEGSHFKSTITGYSHVTEQFSCAQFTGGCVKDELCPQLLPPHCPEGSRVNSVITGFQKVEGTRFSCPVQVLACVDNGKCPQI